MLGYLLFIYYIIFPSSFNIVSAPRTMAVVLECCFDVGSSILVFFGSLGISTFKSLCIWTFWFEISIASIRHLDLLTIGRKLLKHWILWSEWSHDLRLFQHGLCSTHLAGAGLGCVVRQWGWASLGTETRPSNVPTTWPVGSAVGTTSTGHQQQHTPLHHSIMWSQATATVQSMLSGYKWIVNVSI